jgi:glycosyltransferase involved in cell wall biosynthesis
MKLIINTSTLSQTGVTQVAVSFINECMKFPENEYHIFMSKTIAAQIKKKEFPVNFLFYLIESHPIYGLKGFKIRKKLKKLEQQINPDCVFSVFGPSCWLPRNPHLMGYAYPQYVYPESPFFDQLSVLKFFYFKISQIIHKYYLKRDGKYYVCETKDVSIRLANFLNVPKENIYTVTNTFNNFFYEANNNTSNLLLPEKHSDEFRFLSLCSFMPHKNLEILNSVIPLLKNRSKRKIKFILTVDSLIYNKKIVKEVQDSIINIGRIDISQCPQLYKECDALFLPTLLECFSANYPEAMYMGKPILTSNLPFATVVCNDSVLYFNPLNPQDIVEKIIEIVENKELYKDLIQRGKRNLQLFDTAEKRAFKYLEICKKISGK